MRAVPGAPLQAPRGAAREVNVIKLTHMNGQEFVVNAEMIQYIEATPDTIITLCTKERLIVKEDTEEIVRRVIDYGRALRTFPPERI